MSNILSPFFNTDNETDGSGGANGLAGAEDVAAVTLGDKTYVYVAGYTDSAIQIFTLDSKGQLSPAGTVVDTTTNDLRNPGELEVVSAGGQSYLIAKNLFSYAVMRIDPATGGLTLTDNVTDSTATFLRGNDGGLQATEIGGQTFLYMGALTEDAVSVYLLDGVTGRLTHVESVRDSALVTHELNGVRNLHIAEVGGTKFLFASGSEDSGLSVFRIGTDGRLTNTANITDIGPLELAEASGLATAQFGNRTLLYASGFSDNGISVFEVSAAGTLTSVLNQDFGLGAAGGLNGPMDLKVVTFEGASLLFASMFGGDGIVAYSLGTDGIPAEVGRVLDTSVRELDQANRITTVTINGTTFLLASGAIDGGVSVFEIGGGKDLLGGTATGDVLLGFAGDDILSGSGGSDRLYGGGNDDFLIAGAGNDLMRGGDGADSLFGGAGRDTVDYIWSPEGVTVSLATGTGSGGHATGDVLADVENLTGSNQSDRLEGNDTDNLIDGKAGDDEILGLGGSDVLTGGHGLNSLYGGTGNDRLLGGPGESTLDGGEGDDQLFAQGGEDALYGGNGDDLLDGGGRADVLDGGRGRDVLDGGIGFDRLTGAAGDDSLTGGLGRDHFVFFNGDGADVITDYEVGHDRIDLQEHVGVTRFRQLVLTDSAEGLLITIDSDDTLLLQGVTAAEINARSFFF